MKRKMVAMLMAAGMLATSLAACQSTGNTASSQTTEAATSETAASAATEAPADGEVKSVEGLTIAFIPKLTGNAFFESANAGAQEYAKKWGFTVDYVGSSTAAVADQVQTINNAVATGVDGICVSSVDATGLDSAQIGRAHV